MLNPNGDAVAAAGEPADYAVEALLGPGVYWSDQSVTLMNLVDLGTNVTTETEGTPPPTIILPGEMIPNPFSSTNRSSSRRRSDGRPREGTNTFGRTNLTTAADSPPAQPPPDSSRLRSTGEGRPPGDGRPPGPPPFGRPFWMSDAEYKSVIEKQGVHSFLIVLSTQIMQGVTARDLWLRSMIVLLATAAAGVSALAWRNLARTADLQLRLVRASEMNAHLKEMNLAAAGLAHETRNPLNLIRGLAQLISKRPDAPGEIREKSRDIVDEADRVTAQLNEFINYSRPREVRRAPVAVAHIAGEVARALALDAEDKRVQVTVPADSLLIEADEQLLRQTLFNLQLNAIQAVEPGGRIEIALAKDERGEATLEVRDDGPGVPPEHRTEIFKPYFTTHEEGTGLGLAIVQQITSAHGWTIECLPNAPRGAIFRLNHLKVVTKS
jgi:signal transduction histidine kinase